MRPLSCLRTGATQLRLRSSSLPFKASCGRAALALIPTRRSISSQAREKLQAKYNKFFKHEPLPRLTLDDITTRAFQDPKEEPTPLTIHGFIGKPAKGGDSSLTLFTMTTAEGYTIQLASTSPEMLQAVKEITPFSPVRVTGTLRAKPNFGTVAIAGNQQENTIWASDWSLQISEIHALNTFPSNIIVSNDVRFPASARHLQLRFHKNAPSRLLARSLLRQALARAADDRDYIDVETPLLFKPTPEGAREFLVPVRGKPGFAYALPQSPQQYKQMLMASGVEKYVQFARCFRDEDLRADRQPEFTQMDLERAFANGQQVMEEVEDMLNEAWFEMEGRFWMIADENGVWNPVTNKIRQKIKDMQYPPSFDSPFPRMTYAECIDQFGTDKPDLRIPHPIFRFPRDAPIQEFISKTSHLLTPIMEACAIHLDGEADPAEINDKVATFMEGLDNSYTQNPHGAPTALVYDSAQPLYGFASMGHEGFEMLMDAPGMSTLKDGDVVLFQARDDSYIDGSTRLGELRPRLWNHLFAHVPKPKSPEFKFVWVTGFPLFKRTPEGGLASTHHPFTAPLSSRDFDLLFTDPTAATADHYDLVVNGVEVGGGSRRIHIADVQEFVLSEVLQLPERKMSQFTHLLKALRDGCPPHAGFALGFDRLCAVLFGASVKDVIAFPKSHKGEDLFVKAPSEVDAEHWKMYNLAPVHREY